MFNHHHFLGSSSLWQFFRLCFWWSWQFWGVILVGYFIECFSIHVCLLFFSWLGWGYGFCGEEHIGAIFVILRVLTVISMAHHCWLPGWGRVPPWGPSPATSSTCSGSSSNVVFVQCSFCNNVEGKKSITGQGHCLCGVGVFSPHPHVFSLGTAVPTHVPKTCMWGGLGAKIVPVWEWVWVRPVMEGCPVLGGSSLVPWTAGTGSSHLRPWTGISKLEKNYLIDVY